MSAQRPDEVRLRAVRGKRPSNTSHAVASGLDSAVIGEAQVLGQVRRAYASAEANHTVGRTLHELSQRALSVGKRVHSETGIDAAGASVVSVALGMAERSFDGLPAAGQSSSVQARWARCRPKHLARAGSSGIHIVNRSLPRAKRLAENIRELGVAADAFPFDHLPPVLTTADVVVCCTGACGRWSRWLTCTAVLAHGQEPRQLVICDLGMPRDVDPAVAGLPGVRVVDMDRIQREPSARAAASDAEAAARDRRRRGRQLPGRTADGGGHPDCHRTAPAAADVVEAELLRLDNGCPSSTPRIATRLPRPSAGSSTSCCTRRRCGFKQLASAPGGDSYAEASARAVRARPAGRRRRRCGRIALGGNRSRQTGVALD